MFFCLRYVRIETCAAIKHCNRNLGAYISGAPSRTWLLQVHLRMFVFYFSHLNSWKS